MRNNSNNRNREDDRRPEQRERPHFDQERSTRYGSPYPADRDRQRMNQDQRSTQERWDSQGRSMQERWDSQGRSMQDRIDQDRWSDDGGDAFSEAERRTDSSIYSPDQWRTQDRDDTGWDRSRAGFDSQRRGMGMGQGRRPQQEFMGKGPKGYKRSDERIREDISDRLSDGYLDASEIEVTVNEGEVTLSGTVSDKNAKRMAEDIIDDVRGVSEVHNRITVKRQSQSSSSRDSSQSSGMSDGMSQGVNGGTTGKDGKSSRDKTSHA